MPPPNTPHATISTPLPASWTLTPAARLDIFNNTILPAELGPVLSRHRQTSSARPKPQAIILVGQTGAGKTRLAPLLGSSLAAVLASSSSPDSDDDTRTHEMDKSPGYAHLIADTYKTYHPHYAACLAAGHPAPVASALASADARAWLAMACRAAARAGVSCLVESACRHVDDFGELVRIFSSADPGPPDDDHGRRRR